MVLNLRSVADILLDMELDGAGEFLVPGLISSAVTMIEGNPYVGKTYFAIDAARSLTTGDPFLGRDVAKTVDRVAFLCTDPRGWKRTARRVSDAGLDPRRVLAQQFYPPQSWQEWKAAVAELQSERVGAVVVDNTTDLAADANEPRDVKVLTDGMRLWSDNGAAILNVHHLNKYGQTFGSILWNKWASVELKLAKSGSRRKLTVLANDAEQQEFKLAFDPRRSPVFTVTDERSRPAVQRDGKTLDQNARIAAWLIANKGHGLSQRQAAAKATADLGFNVSQTRISRVANMSIRQAA